MGQHEQGGGQKPRDRSSKDESMNEKGERSNKAKKERKRKRAVGITKNSDTSFCAFRNKKD